MTARARALVLRAVERGWSGPPFDPVQLAGLLGIPLEPKEDLQDARTVPVGRDSVRIEFNPNRPRARVRFSIAHELAHTFFDDCAAATRNRGSGRLRSDEWQLELLCNVAAAELLMPIGTFGSLADEPIGIDNLMRLRERYDVSAEAILLRYAKLSRLPCAAFVVGRHPGVDDDASYRVDYVVPSRTWPDRGLRRGLAIPAGSHIEECTAVGFTAKGDENWIDGRTAFHVECVGVSPYPGSPYPRVAGIVSVTKAGARAAPRRLDFVVGDATLPRGSGYRIVGQVVNDRSPTWGGGFARVAKGKWPSAQTDFSRWSDISDGGLELGRIHGFEIEPGLCLVSMIAQHGYGRSHTPRIRYDSLRTCLAELGTLAQERRATVHFPRIGCGEAGGDWAIVEELIEDELCARGIGVIVYDLPSQPFRATQPQLLEA